MSKIDTLTQKRDEINEQIKKLKARESLKRRKEDTKRKILIGGVVIKMLREGEMPEDRLNQILDKHLEKDADRALFELPVKKKDGVKHQVSEQEPIGAQ